MSNDSEPARGKGGSPPEPQRLRWRQGAISEREEAVVVAAMLVTAVTGMLGVVTEGRTVGG